MRKKFGNGSKLTKAQKTLPDFLKKKIMASKNKKKKKSPREKAMGMA